MGLCILFWHIPLPEVICFEIFIFESFILKSIISKEHFNLLHTSNVKCNYFCKERKC